MSKREDRKFFDRLMHLRDVISRVKPVAFNMARWSSFQRDDFRSICGTACCLLGHAACDPKFKQSGLRWAGLGYTDWSGRFQLPGVEIEYKDTTDYDAGVKFFNLTTPEGVELFLDETEKPKAKAKQIYNLVKRKYPELLREYEAVQGVDR